MVDELCVFRKRYLYQFIWIYFMLRVFLFTSRMKIQEVYDFIKILLSVTLMLDFPFCFCKKRAFFGLLLKFSQIL